MARPKREPLEITPAGAVPSPGIEPQAMHWPANMGGTMPPPEPEPELLPDDIEFQALLHEYGENSGASIRIYRQGRGGYRDLTFIGEMSPSEFSPARLQEPPYNGGEFRLHFRDDTGLRGNRLLKIEPRQQAVAPASDTAGILAAMQEGFRSMSEALAKVLQPAPQPSRAEFLAELAAIRNLFAPAQTGPSSSELMEMFLRGMTMAREMAPSPGEATGNDVLLEATKTLLPAIIKQIDAAPDAGTMQQIPQPNPAPVQHSIPTPPQSAQTSAPQSTQGNPQMNVMVRAFAGILLAQAQQNSDPAPYAAMILDNVPEETVRKFIEPETWFDEFTKHLPQAKQYQEWFAELRNIVLEMLNAPEEDDGAASPPAASSQGA